VADGRFNLREPFSTYRIFGLHLVLGERFSRRARRRDCRSIGIRRVATGAVVAIALFGRGNDGRTTVRADAAAEARPVGPCPSFAVKLGNGSFIEHPEPTSRSDGTCLFVDTHLEAAVAPLADQQWELRIQTRDTALKEVWFPWEPQAQFLNNDLDDDVLYYPHLMGLAWAARWVTDSTWQGRDYPGYCFSPLAVIADDSDARMVAATNWPPTRVSILYGRYRLGLRYDDPMSTNSIRSFRALVASVRGNEATGELPWHVAISQYKNWLLDKLKSEGLYPIPYPSWLKRIHGWQNVQLQNLHDGELSRVRENWDRFKSHLPWLQMWGQMSNFFPTPGEETGCCLDRPELHPRYQSILPDLVRAVAAEGRVGFYSRPRSPYGSMTGAIEADKRNRRFLVDWIQRNQVQVGANSFYIDVLGAECFGDPLAVAQMFGDTFPREAVIERPVDVYPAAFLISGSLWGGKQCTTSPGQYPEQMGKNLRCVTFPRFGRYLLDDRILFLGESNGDHMFWGTARGHDYWTERQVFLLGAKFDAMRVADSERTPERMNRAVEWIIKERDNVGWWGRDPVYLDTVGLSEVPAGVEVRRFRGNQGEELLVIDNWKRRAGQHVRLLGRLVNIPDNPISILVMEP